MTEKESSVITKTVRKSDYDEFINNSEYLDVIDKWNKGIDSEEGAISEVYSTDINGWIVFDMNGDGAEELIMSAADDFGFRNVYVFSSDGGTVTMCGAFYCCYFCCYENLDGIFVCPTRSMDGCFDFYVYKLINNELAVGETGECVNTDVSGGSYTIGSKLYTEDQFNEYLGRTLEIEYHELKNESADALSPGTYIVSTKSDDLIVHNVPKSGTAHIDRLPKGTEVMVTGGNADWSYISYSGKTGWVSNDYLSMK